MNRPRAWRLLAVAIALGVGGPAPGYGQGFSLRLERGEIGMDGRGHRRVAGSAASDYQQWLRLPLSGYLVHPAVLRYSLSVRPLFGRHYSSVEGQGSRTSNLGFNLSATAFQARRLTLTAQTIRASGSNRGDFGTHSEFRNSGFGAVLFIRDRYFPTTVTYSDRSVQDRWESPYAPQPVERDQRSSRLRAEIRNRRLTTTVEQTRFRDLRGSGDHDALTARAQHRIEWGKGSSLGSSFIFYRRVGSTEMRRTSWAEQASIQHTKAVSTSLSFSRQSWSRSFQSARSLSYEATSQYSADRALDASLTVGGQRFTGGIEGGVHRFRIAPSVRYLLELPAGIRLNTSASVGSERLSRSIPSDLLLDVLEEAHDVDATLSFALHQLRVDRESIEVWDEARTLLLVEGVDFRVVETGPQLEIQILPGGRVREGEVVLVNYRYRTLAGEETQLWYVNYESALRIGGFSVKHGRRQRSLDTSTGGTLPTLSDVDLWFGASYSGRTPFGGFSLDASRRSRSALGIQYSTNEVRGEFTPPALGRVEGRIRGSTSRTVTAEHVTNRTSAGGSLIWPASRAVRVTVGVDGWIWGGDGRADEGFVAGRVRVTWRFGQIDTAFGFDQARRSNGIRRIENRWSVRVVRRL